MSASKAVHSSPDLSDGNSFKPATPLTRNAKVTKKRTITTMADEADDGLLEMDLSASNVDDGSPRRLTFSPISPSPDASTMPLTSPNPHTNVAPPPGSRVPASDPGPRQLFANLPTVIRLTPAVPPGRMELVQTGIKMELAITNLSRAATRGLEEYANERAASFRERAEFTVERIKLYVQAGEVVLFGKVGTAFDVRALHYLFVDLAKGSHLHYCHNTFPDLATAVENARPWFNQGEHAACSVRIPR